MSRSRNIRTCQYQLRLISAKLTQSQPWTNFWNAPGKPPSKDKLSESRYALVDINITHPIRTTQLAISHFLAAKKPGVVTHISSVGGQTAFFPTPVYVASKHAINGLVRSLHRLEQPRGDLPKIRVNAVAPGLIKTPLWTDHPEKMKFVDENNDLWVTPEAVADVMLDLVENEEHVGGTILEVGKTVRRVEMFNDPYVFPNRLLSTQAYYRLGTVLYS